MSSHRTNRVFSSIDYLEARLALAPVLVFAAIALITSPALAVGSVHRHLADESWRHSESDPPTETIDGETRPVLISSTSFSYMSVAPDGSPVVGSGTPVGRKRWRFDFEHVLPERMAIAREVLVFPRVKRTGKWRPTGAVVAQVTSNPRRSIEFQLVLPSASEQGVWITGYAIRLEPSNGSFDLEVPRGAVLHFGIGVLEAWQRVGPVAFTIEACTLGACETVFSETVPVRPAGTKLSGWADRQASLAGYAGREITLRFATKAGDKGKLVPLAFFADPVLSSADVVEEEGPNLLLISIDTLRADHLGSYGYTRDTSPYIDQYFRNNGSTFERCISASSSTMPSHMTMMTSLTPSVHGSRNTRRLPMPAGVKTLPQWLHQKGFVTAAITENGAIARSRGFGRGFAIHRENRDKEGPEKDRTIEKTFGQGLELIRSMKGRRFFVFLHTYKPHTPYLPPTGYRDLFGKVDREFRATKSRPKWAPRFYDREIRYTDDQLSILLEALKREGLLDNTIVVFTSDHGAAFLEHGFLAHGALVYEEVLNVPLMLSGPGIPKGLRINELVGLIDLMPSMLDLLGVEHPPGLMGRSFRGLLSESRESADWHPEPIISEAWVGRAVAVRGNERFLQPTYAVRDGAHKLIRFRTKTGYRFELYNLDADPGEKQNLYEEESVTGMGESVASRLRGQLESYEAQIKALRSQLEHLDEDAESQRPNPRDTDMLKALGEPPRVCRRLHSLRGWGHGTKKQVFPRGTRAGGSNGVRALGRARIRVGGDAVDFSKDRLFS